MFFFKEKSKIINKILLYILDVGRIVSKTRVFYGVKTDYQNSFKWKQYVLILFFINCPIKAYCFSENKLNEFEKFADELIDYLKIPGAAISIVTDNEVLFQKLYGVKRKGEQNKITKNTVFRICSISKSLTSYLIYKLAKKGINVDDPISKYLPEVIIHNKEFTKNIKLKHILSHSVGIKNHCLEEIAYLNQPASNLYDKLQKVEKICEPGKEFQYQNVVFSLSAPLLENAFNKSFKELMEFEILKPLELDNTIISQKDYNELSDLAIPHCKIKNKFIAVNPKSYYYNILAAAGISSNISDMSKFLQSLLKEIKKDSLCLDFFFKHSVNANYKIKILEKKDYNYKAYPRILSWEYGLGWYKENYAGHKLIFHSGRLSGFRSTLMFSPELGIGIIVLTNSSEGRLITILRHYFADLLFDLESISMNELKGIFKKNDS